MTIDVLHVIHQFPPESRGGSESYTFDVAQRQRALGKKVEVWSGSKFWRERLTIESGEHEGLPVHRVHRDDAYFDHHVKSWHPGVEAAFARFLVERRPAVVHVQHWVRLTFNLVEICWRHGIPAIVTLHDYWTSCPRAFRRRVGDEACRRPLSAASCGDCVPRYGYESPGEIADGIEHFADHYRAELSLAAAVLVAVGSTADLLSRTTGVPRDRYEVLPLGYRPRFHGMPPLPPPSPGAPVRFAFWGGIGRHKGAEVLVRAFRRLLAARPGRVELHVLGGFESPEYERELRELAHDLPIVLYGPFTPAQLHAAAPHVGVFPSTCLETYGLVLDECFELQLPCITSDLGAVAERAGSGGLRTRAGDDQDLAAAMQRFVDEPELWHQLRDRRPPPSPSLEMHVDALLAVYDRARQQPRRELFVPPVGPERRLQFLLQQRESAMGKLIPPGGPR